MGPEPRQWRESAQGFPQGRSVPTEQDSVGDGVQAGAAGRCSGLEERLWEEESLLEVKS